MKTIKTIMVVAVVICLAAMCTPMVSAAHGRVIASTHGPNMRLGSLNPAGTGQRCDTSPEVAEIASLEKGTYGVRSSTGTPTPVYVVPLNQGDHHDRSTHPKYSAPVLPQMTPAASSTIASVTIS